MVEEQARLRLAEPADAEAIGALTREAYAKWVPLIGREPLPMTINYAQALATHRFDLLHVGEDLAALIETVADGDQLLVVNVAVRPALQGRGLGVRLMALAEQIAADAGLSGVRLYTNQRFAANIALYTSLGYRIDREEALNGGVAVHMSKRVDHPGAIAAAIACVEAFTERFNAGDAAGMDALLHFPHVILDGARLIVWKTPANCRKATSTAWPPPAGGAAPIKTSAWCCRARTRCTCWSTIRATARAGRCSADTPTSGLSPLRLAVGA